MSLDKILQALETEAEHQVAAIEQTTRAQIDQIQTQARAEVELVRQKRLVAIQTPLQAEQARILNKAKLEALQIVLGTREALLADLFEAAVQQLAALSKLEGYDRLLQQLLEEAVAALGKAGAVRATTIVQPYSPAEGMGRQALPSKSESRIGASAPFHVEVQSQDIDLMQNIVQTMGLQAVVEGTLKNEGFSALGGVAVTTSDGKIRLVNTLEARLGRVANLYRAQVAEMLFDQAKES
jgi:V/A-type H+/Na+-transporting ATPase subunit E